MKLKHFFLIPKRWIKDKYYNLKYFYQRCLRQGPSDSDIWNLNTYLIEILTKSFTEFEKRGRMGTPCSFFNGKKLYYPVFIENKTDKKKFKKLEDTYRKQWDTVLKEIRIGFKAMSDILEDNFILEEPFDIKIYTKKRVILRKKFKKAMFLVERNFECFWD